MLFGRRFMFLRFNRLFFAAIWFAFQMGFLMAFIYAVIMVVGMKLFSSQPPVLGMVLAISSYVAVLCALSSFLAFSLSPFLRKWIQFSKLKHEGYFVVSLAACIANLTLLTLAPWSRSLLAAVNLFVSLVGVFLGSFVYMSTAKKLERVMKDRSDV